MANIKLKPCPFCGGKAKLVKDNGGWYQVWCIGTKCFANSGWWKEEKDAVETWNRRVNNG